MRIIAIVISVLFSIPVIAQEDSTATVANSPTYTGLVTLKRADIERLPAVHFLDLVQGAFPFIATEMVEEDYTFVVNGFILINPNAINISQIESIRFFPAGTALSRGSLQKKGTFVISTLPQENRISFSTKTGLQIGQDKATAGNNYTSGLDNGLFSANELTYQKQTSRSYISGSASFLRNEFPDYRNEDAIYITHTKSAFNRTRLSGFGGYRFNPRWKVDGGLFFTALPRAFEMTRDHYVILENFQKQEQHLNHAGAHAALTFFPSIKINNVLTIEATHASDDNEQNSESIQSGGIIYTTDSDFKGKYKSYAISNQINWRLINNARFGLEASLLARYHIATVEEDKRVEWHLNGQTSFSQGSHETKRNSFSVTPTLSFHFQQILFAEAGVTHDTYHPSLYEENTSNEILPNAGIRLQLASLLKTPVINSFVISSNYIQSINNYDKMDKLELNDYFIRQEQIIFINTKGAYQPSKTWLSTVDIEAFDNRLGLQASYRNYNRTIRALQPAMGGAYLMYFEPLSSNTLAFEINSLLVKKDNMSWKLHGMLYSEKNNKQINYPAENVYYDAGKNAWRGGVRTTATINRFFLQAIALLHFNEYGMNESGNYVDDVNKYNTHFILLGYKLPVGFAGLESFEVNIQTRNLFGSNEFTYNKYVGAGVHINL